jgi:PAS domain S-box-containing protein
LIAEHAADLIAVIDANDQRLYNSPSYQTILGYTAEELQHTWAFEQVHPDDRPQLIKAAREALRTGKGVKLEYRMRHKDGSWRVLESSSSVICDGECAYLVIVARDITERKRNEEMTRALERKLLEAQKLESLGVLAGGIAHDFNNLLVSVLGNAGLALLELPADSPLRPALEDIEIAAKRASDLTQQMLAYAGRGRFAVQSVQLNEIIIELSHLLRVSITKQATLHFHLTPDLPLIEADATQLRQIVMNLMVNASDALGHQQGDITVTTDVIHADRALLHEMHLGANLPAGDYVCLTVADTGCGMDEATQAKIFEPFFTTKTTGRGLGLAAVLGIARGHKGALQVTSALGRGTTFRVLLPVRALPTITQPVTTQPETEWRGHGLLLVVDDEPGVRAVTTRMLERLGFSVLQAADGREALALARVYASEISCTLLDMTMPHMDGNETFRALRQLHPQARVLLMSGYSGQEALHGLASDEAVAFMQKPFTPAELREQLRRLLRE